MYNLSIHFLVTLSVRVIHYHIENLFLNLQHIVINMSFLINYKYTNSIRKSRHSFDQFRMHGMVNYSTYAFKMSIT